MSQDPYGYGQYPGLPPPPPPPNQYAYPNPAAYPPAPSYGSPQGPSAPAPNYYAMTQSAYDYNSSIPGIPGLGIGGTPVAGTPYPPPPPLPAWNHQVNPQFAAGTDYAPSRHQYSVPAQFNGPAEQSYQPPPSYNKAQTLPPNTAPVPHLTNTATQSSDEMEEGELSEGQFEDLYKPVDSSGKSKDATVPPNVPAIPNQSQPASTVDTPSGGFYTNEEDASDGRDQSMTGAGASADAQGQDSDGHQTGRERSGSYSPYLSPREIHAASTLDHASQSTQGYQANVKVGQTALNGTDQGRVPGLGQPANSAPDASNTSNGVPTANSAPARNPTTNGKTDNNNEPFTPGYISLAEARKEAQKAILKLWPLGVRGKHYIDEGIDEKVVKGLFSDLHLDFSTGKPVQPDATQPTRQSLPSEPRTSAPATSKSPSTERKSLAQPQIGNKPSEGDKMDKSEERKDRIARLLAEKAAKGPAPTLATAATTAAAPAPIAIQAAVSVRPPAPATAPARDITQAQALAPSIATPQASTAVPAQHPPTSLTAVPAVTNPTMTARSSTSSTPTGPKPKTKTKEEIERLLRQKMEALQKSRERGAEKAESDKISSSPVKNGGAQTVTLQPTIPVLERSSTANTTPEEQSTQDKGPIPRLFLSSASQAMQPVNVRKRPVAADFVDYPASDSLKRPFGQKRQNSSLVIDVSDGSDDEEMDIDMDMDSPDETPLTIQRSNTPGRKGPSLAEFPPLRDLSRRNVHSPASGTNTPPSGYMSTKEKELLAKETAAKERAIQEMRRRIAEIEAKQKAKKGSQTPNQAAATPSQSNDSASSGAIVPRPSSVAAGKIDAPSAQLISEAVSARLPKPSESSPKENAQTERSRSVSVSASRANAALEEKKKQLAALREAREAKKREAEERMKAEQARMREEEERMQEEEARLQAELEQDAEMENGTDDDNQSERMSVDEESEEETRGDEEAKETGETQAIASPQTSLPQTQKKQSSPAAPTSYEVDERERTEPAAAEPQDGRMSDQGHGATESANSLQADDADTAQETTVAFAANDNQDLSTSSQQQVEDVPMEEQASDTAQASDSSMDDGAANAGQPVEEHGSGSDEHVDGAAEGSVGHVAIHDSPEFSPEPADDPSSNAAGYLADQIGEQPVPATISDVPQSRDDTQEVEGGPVNSELNRAAAPKSTSTFVPYESPLRYFRAFRFHPEFNKVVPGGVKSLTYSNKIDPRKELCPDELQGGACPRGEDCEFQHLSSIRVSDEQILVELGKSDDYTGEQRDRFIQGLKELLQDFRARKTRDFDTIANGIIEFRARFLGDKSKILPLEGVTL